jgi:hypothetical protein
MRRIARHRPSPALVVSIVALVVALGGTSYAAVTLPTNSVGSAQIKRGGVKASDIAANAVRSATVKDHSLLGKDFKAGELPAGPQGPSGAKGANGANGAAAGFTDAVASRTLATFSGEQTIATLNLPAGDYLLSAKMWLENPTGGAVIPACFLRAGSDFDETRAFLEVNGGGSSNAAALPFELGHTFAAPGAVTLTCDVVGVAGVLAQDPRISAVQVQTLTRSGI